MFASGDMSVDGWRKGSPRVDAVRGEKTFSLCPLFVLKCGLKNALTVVKVTAHGEGTYTIAPAAELLLLSRRNFVPGKRITTVMSGCSW